MNFLLNFFIKLMYTTGILLDNDLRVRDDTIL